MVYVWGMDRPIEFRGLRADGKGWETGSLAIDGDRYFIVPFNGPINLSYLPKEDESYHVQLRAISHQVLPSTVGQFTGLLDKNGVEIFEGDMLGTSNNNPAYDEWTFEECGFTTCIQSKMGWSFSDWRPTDGDASMFSMMFCEIIGNIHEKQ